MVRRRIFQRGEQASPSIFVGAGALSLLGVAGCSGDLPHDNGVAWHCRVQAERGGLVVGSHPDDGDLFICANPNVSPGDVADACEDACEDKWCVYGIHFDGDFGLDFCSGATCRTVGDLPSPSLGQECDESVDPGGPARADLVVSGSATVSVEDESGNASASGILRYTVPPCGSADCPMILVLLELDIPTFDIDGVDISAVVRNANNPEGIWHSATNTFEFPPGSLGINANFSVDDERGSTTIFNGGTVGGNLDPDGDSFSFSGTFADGDTTITISSLTGTHTNRPPVAAFDPSGPLECNAPLVALTELDGTPSSDPDDNLEQFLWFVGDTFVGNLQVQPVSLDLGSSHVHLELFDSLSAVDAAFRNIVVVDTTPPVVTSPPDLFVEACDTLGAVVDPGEAEVTDVCDPNPSLDAFIVDVNGVAVNVPLPVPNRFRQGVTTIAYVGLDATGDNETIVFQTVTLDFGPSCCPADLEALVGTEDDDVLEGGNRGQCISGLGGDDVMSGQNQADVLFCGLGADQCGGDNQSDTVRGGVGDDFVTGGNGREDKSLGLWGGPGNDQILGGNGRDFIRGGAGIDHMVGGNGNDVFVIAAVCEVLVGESIEGGLGTDRVESPLTEAELAARGVVVTGIEEFVVVPTLPDAECLDP